MQKSLGKIAHTFEKSAGCKGLSEHTILYHIVLYYINVYIL